jgi:hypothetical protein
MNVRSTRTRQGLIATGVALAAIVGTGANGQKFRPSDPLSTIIDAQDASGVLERQVDLINDMLENSLYWPGDRTPDVRAQNVNTIDEVPDSTWFTNRLGVHPTTIDDLLQGPDAGAGPAPGRWTVIGAMSRRAMPVFTVRDSAGQVWWVIFDRSGFPAVATGTQVVVTKLVWARGERRVKSRQPRDRQNANDPRRKRSSASRQPNVWRLWPRSDRQSPEAAGRPETARCVCGEPLATAVPALVLLLNTGMRY